MRNSLVITQEPGGDLWAHLSGSKSTDEAQENLQDGVNTPKVLACILLDGTDSRMSAVAEVIEMALELDVGDPDSAVRAFLLKIFAAGCNSAKPQ